MALIPSSKLENERVIDPPHDVIGQSALKGALAITKVRRYLGQPKLGIELYETADCRAQGTSGGE